MAVNECRLINSNIPQWKKDLIIRRRAVGQVLPTESGSVELTCPSVVAAVRLAEYSVDSNFFRSCRSKREQTGAHKNMRFVEQVNASHDFVEPSIILGIKDIITKIESGSSVDLKMGEEKSAKKNSSSSIINDKKTNNLCFGDGDDCASDSSEELKYGPGIVSKLKSKYLSLTLRENQGKVRPSLNSLRKATSLENILNGEEGEKSGDHKSNYLKKIQLAYNESSESRHRGLVRNNKESMKRARSVEVLTKYDRGNFRSQINEENNKDDVKNSRKRISSVSVEEKELPPPDLVKQTLQIFEKSQNSNNVSNYKNKVQKKVPEYVSGKKSVVNCSKSFRPKQNGIENGKISKIVKTSVNNYSLNSISNRSKSYEKIISKNIENCVENNSNSIPKPDIIDAVEKRKIALKRENSNESVIINKNSNNENIVKPIIKDDDNHVEKNFQLSSNHKENGLSLDLTDLAVSQNNRKKGAAIVNSTSKNNGTENGGILTDYSSETKRCISPVLVRAPPSILSSELNSTHTTPCQPMKQVGVIRPIVTNKKFQSNSSIKQQVVNKCQLTEREIEKNLINQVKSIEQPVTKVIVSLKKSSEECFPNDGTKSSDNVVKRGQYWDKKPNSMIFNFSNRKTVPDYIENDGLILTPRKEKPKVSCLNIIIFK